MTKKVPYMTPEAIEQDAAALLAEYARARGVVIVPPIPIEDILEKHLKLGIEFDDTHKLFGIPRSGTDPGSHPFVEVPLIKMEFCGIDWSDTVEDAFDRIAGPLAEQFLVSPIAMRIRLEKLGLLLREVPHQHLLAGA